MRTQYWYNAKRLLMHYGFSKFKAMSLAWKMKHAADDLATFKNPDNIVEAIQNALKISDSI